MTQYCTVLTVAKSFWMVMYILAPSLKKGNALLVVLDFVKHVVHFLKKRA